MDSINNNLLLLTDSYKVSHHLQYPKGMTFLKSYFESRGGKYPEVVFFGLQRTLKKYLTQKVTTKMIDEAEQALNAHYGRNDVFNREGWTYIVKEHKGKIPIRIRAVPEGSLVPVRNVLFTVESTDPKVPWVVNYFESLLVQSWYPMTCCTGSFMQKRVIKQAMEKTADTLDTLDFKVSLEILPLLNPCNQSTFRVSSMTLECEDAPAWNRPASEEQLTWSTSRAPITWLA